MRDVVATGHMLVGAAICHATGNPWLGAPAAFVSHYVGDAFLQLGAEDPSRIGWLAKKLLAKGPMFMLISAVDLVIGFSLLCLLVGLGSNAFLFWLGGIVAIIPDFEYISDIKRLKRFRLLRLFNLPPLCQIKKFHARLHLLLPIYNQVIWGLYVVCFLGVFIFLLRFLRFAS